LMKQPGVKLFECIRPGEIQLESAPAVHHSPHLPRRLPHVDPGPGRL
jgi:hypothetical protein